MGGNTVVRKEYWRAYSMREWKKIVGREDWKEGLERCWN
jgi:hypothetical protein